MAEWKEFNVVLDAKSIRKIGFLPILNKTISVTKQQVANTTKEVGVYRHVRKKFKKWLRIFVDATFWDPRRETKSYEVLVL